MLQYLWKEYFYVQCSYYKTQPLRKKANIHQLTTILATFKKSYF